MLLLLITLILNQVNASSALLPKDGKYKFNKFEIEINVQDGKATTAKIYKDQIPLIKKDNIFYGELKNGNTTTSFKININDKKSLLVEVEQKTILPKIAENMSYHFKDLGIKLLIENNLISKLYTGLSERSNSATELRLSDDGTIAGYTIYSKDPYTLKTENSQIKEFWCNDCEYKIGPTKNSIMVSESSYTTFSPNIIEMYSCEGIKKIIETHDGKYLDISVFFYENSDLINGSTQFKVEDEDVIYQNSSKFITRKSF